jgi:hypothetical protein
MSEVTFVKIKGPDTDRWSKGTGAEYEVRLNGVTIGKVYSARLASPPPRGSRIRSGAEYTAWGAELQLHVNDARSNRFPWSDTRIRAARWLVEAINWK